MSAFGIYRAKVVKEYSAGACQVKIPQLFGDVTVTVTRFLSTDYPLTLLMGWVTFEGGVEDYPVWMRGDTSVSTSLPGVDPEVLPTGPFSSIAVTIGDGVTTSFVIPTGFNSRDFTVAMYNLITFQEVSGDYYHDLNSVTVSFLSPPAVASYRVLIVKIPS